MTIGELYADAFADDPGWNDVGPDDRRRRWRYTAGICGAEARLAERLGGQTRTTVDDGEPSAAIVWFPPGTPRPPWRLFVAQAPAAVAAGPAALARALRADATMTAGHPPEDHLYVSLLAAHPGHQRGGRGRALLQQAIEEARRLDVPVFLDTANPANLSYYRQFGFEVRGQSALPRGAQMWFLLRG